jgi:hypothetical protein
LFLPIAPDDPWAAEMREQVSSRCRVFRVDVQASKTPAEVTDLYSRLVSDEESWKIGTDTDRRAGCDSSGWTVYLDPEAEKSFSGELYIQCTPN